MAIYGSQTTTTALAIAVVTKRGSKFTCPSDLGTVDAISAYCDRSGTGGSYAVTCAIYTDNAGAPNALVADSAIQISSNISRNSAGWYTGTYSGTKPVLTPGNVYWLVALFTKDGSTYYAAGGTNQQADLADTLPFDDPFGGSPTYANSAMAIYVTYTLAPVPKTLADSGAGADALTVEQIVAKALADTGAGVDVLSALQGSPALADGGSGSDAQVIAAVVALLETGGGSDALTVTQEALKSLVDAGAGEDLLSLVQTMAVALVDAGSGTDAMSVSEEGGSADKTFEETGVGVDVKTILADLLL